ncbi:MAG: redoxin domain-containing protein [Pyrinomonadaceae bacterium]
MRTRITQTILIASFLLVLAGRVFAQPAATATLPVLKDLHGGTIGMDQYKGKVVLVNFWATWCPPCRAEIPHLIRWQREYKNRGLQVVGITYPPQTLPEVRRFTRKFGVNYPVALGTRETKLLFTQSDTLPITVIFDSDGNVRALIEGVIFPEEFDQKIRPLLADQSKPVPKTSVSKRNSSRLQRRTIVVNAEGYEPANLKLRKGVPARLIFIRKVDEGCGTEIVIPAYRINRRLPLNVPVVVSFTPTRSGRFKLTCGMDMFRGTLVVR